MQPWLLLLACTTGEVADSGGAADTGSTGFSDPSQPGPHPVGTDTRSVTGSWGTDLTVQAWFPRTSAEGQVHVYDDLVSDQALDGGSALCPQPLPVVVFSHGNQGVRWQSFYLTQHLASHGWLVVAPDHTANTFFDYDSDAMPELVFRRPVDVADAFDLAVARSSDPDDPLHDCVDADAGYAVMGHSFGGYTTLAVAGAVIDTDQVAATCATAGGWLCDEVAQWAAEHPDQTVWDQSDPRAWAAVAFAPAAWETLSGGLPLVDVPTQIQAGTLDTTTPWAGTVQPIWRDLAVEPRAAALVDGAGHFSFSDVCTFLPTYPDCDAPYRDPADVHDISRTLALAWVQSALGWSEADAWLPPPDDPRLESWQEG